MAEDDIAPSDSAAPARATSTPATSEQGASRLAGGSRDMQDLFTKARVVVRLGGRASKESQQKSGTGAQDGPTQSQEEMEIGQSHEPPGVDAGLPEHDHTSPQNPYRLEVITIPEGQPPLVDIVAVHDYDETSVNWTYKDKEAILRQKIDDIRAEKSKLPETAVKVAGTDGRVERGRQASLADPTKLVPGPAGKSLAPPDPILQRAPSLQDVRKEAESVERTGAGATGLAPPEVREAISSRNTEVGSSRASSPSGQPYGVNWLQNATMLPKAVPGVRVLGFCYPTGDLRKLLADGFEREDKFDFVESAASELLIELKKARSTEAFGDVPVVFVAAGFGGVIVQKALSLTSAGMSPQTDGQKTGSTAKKTPPKDPEHGIVEDATPLVLPQLNLDRIADIIFMDAPFPKKDGEGLSGFFPRSAASVRISGIQKLAKKMETEWDAPGIDKIWADFWTSLSDRGRAMRIAWFYSSGTSNTTGAGKTNTAPQRISPTFEDRRGPVITLNRVPLQRSGFRRLTNFRDAKDPGYAMAISRLHQSLMIVAVQDEKLTALQLSLLQAGAPVNSEDEWGLSLLHLAVMAPNPDGLLVLLKNHADPQKRDWERQTPLLLAIKQFCNSNPSPDTLKTKALKTVIVRLLDYTTKPELNTTTDNRGRTARAILEKRGHDCVGVGCRHTVVQDLLSKHRPYVRKRLGDDKEDPWKNWNPPAEGSLQRRACEAAKGILAEFYDSAKDGPMSDYEVHTVLDLIYQKEAGPAKILSKWSETNISRHGQEVHCRWIHVPANNEQWIHDLFVRLRLRDNSMDGQRHRGYTVWNQYMVADAKRYRQTPFPPSIEIQVPGLGVIHEESNIEGQHLPEGAGAGGILEPDSPGWLDLPVPKGLDAASDAIVLFMPVLAFEEHRPRKKMTRAIRKTLDAVRDPGFSLSRRSSTLGSTQSGVTDGGPAIDTSVVEAYLEHERPIHCRRTLDQYRYYMLEDTEARDLDQVVYKWARQQQHDKAASREDGRAEKNVFAARNRPVIMVDQLWLWVLPDGTVVSSLPNTADPNEAYNLGYKLESAIFDGTDMPVRSADDLVTVILKNCVDFFKRDGPCGVRFHDCFQYTISRIAEDEARTYAQYKNAVNCLEELKRRKLLRTLSQKYTDTFSQITEETNRLVEIMDIQDELSIVESVLLSQKNVLQRLIHRMHQKKARTQKGDAAAREIALRDSSRIQEVIQIVDDNINSVKEMDTSAKKVQEDLKQLLDFKQQQSNAWEMHYSMRLSVQGQKQNNIMLVFTLVTIIFLPMSFMSSFFAINVEGFPLSPASGEIAWPLGRLCAYLFGISIALSIPLILAAFYVNDITRMAQKKNSEDPFGDDGISGSNPADDDSDEEDDDNGMDPSRRKRSRRDRYRYQNPDSLQGEEYAPLFGYFTFHTMIPFFRRLWKYYPYRLYEGDIDIDEELDDLDWDYPLSRNRKRFAEPINRFLLRIGLRKLGMAFLNHEQNYMLDRTPDGLFKELLKEKMELRERERNAEAWRERMEADNVKESGNSSRSRSPGRAGKGVVWAGVGEAGGQEVRSRAGFGFRDAFGRRRSQGLGGEI